MRAANAKIAGSGRPDDEVGVQNSVPAITPGRPSTSSGTFQSNTLLRTLLSSTCSGSSSDIQCMRWSCHSKRPVFETSSQRGSPFESALSGASTFPSRSSLR